MITVRFPSGFSIQYNDANYVHRHGEYSDIWDNSAKETWFAQAPNSCVIERHIPCRTYNPVATDSDKVQASIESLEKEVRSLSRKIAKVKS